MNTMYGQENFAAGHVTFGPFADSAGQCLFIIHVTKSIVLWIQFYREGTYHNTNPYSAKHLEKKKITLNMLTQHLET